jgi:hypothetical protein
MAAWEAFWKFRSRKDGYFFLSSVCRDFSQELSLHHAEKDAK